MSHANAAPGETHVASLWLPHSDGRQPFQGQIMSRVVVDDDFVTPLDYAVQLSWYIPTEIQGANRVEFSDDETDAVGLPRMRFHFSYSEADLATIAAGREVQRTAGEALGDFDPHRDFAVLARAT